ncbi:hypothetical protein LguiA_021337 [Lonicera macranthoides]
MATPFLFDQNRHYCGFTSGNKIPTPISTTVTVENKSKSYVKALGAADLNLPPLEVDVSKLSIPSLKGNEVVVTLNEEIYQQSLQECRSNLIGRLLLSRVSDPVSAEEVCRQVTKLWNPGAGWRIVPLGRGFFDMHFATIEEMQRIQSRISWNLPCGLFRVMPWQADFNPKAPKTSRTQVWIRIEHISQEYWHTQLILEIARGVGVPLQMDSTTKNRRFGHFARVLVDVDMAGNLPSVLWVERKGHGFRVEITYEKLPLFCSGCGIVGHSFTNCRAKSKQVRGKPVAKLDRVIPMEGAANGRIVDLNKHLESIRYRLMIDLVELVLTWVLRLEKGWRRD